MGRSLVVVALGLMLPLASFAQSVRGTAVTAGAEPVSGVVVQLSTARPMSSLAP